MIPSHANTLCRTLADLLATCPVGGVITYEQMTAKLGFDVRDKSRHLIPAAIRLVNREIGAVFAVVIRHGYRRLPDDELAAAGHATRLKIRRKAGRSAKTLTRAVDASNAMSDASKLKVMSEIAVLGLIQRVARDATVKAAEKAPSPPSSADVARATLAAFASA